MHRMKNKASPCNHQQNHASLDFDVYRPPDSKNRITGNQNPSKWVLEQAACATIGIVDRFCVGVEQISELLAWGCCFKMFRSLQDFYLLHSFNAHQEMEVIAQQAVRIRVCNTCDVPGVELQEVRIIALFYEDVFPVVAAVVDVVVTSVLKGCWFSHVT